MLPHRDDNSNLCRRHKLEQLPSCLPSSKWKNYTFSHFLTFKWCVKLESQLTVMQQVAIVLHYSSLSTLLWFGISARVIYKEAVWQLPQQLEGESPTLPPQRPMLRSVNTVHLNPHCIPGLCCSLSVRI